MKSLTVVDYLAWAVIAGSGLVVLSLVLAEFKIVSFSGLLVFGMATLNVVTFLYPIVVLRYRIKTNSYVFLRKTVHYVALPLCLYIWLASFL